jgi:PhnB protein
MLIPHLHFCGNCAEAIALYEQAFGTKTDILFLNGNGDDSVGHAEMLIHGARVMLNDRFGKKGKTADCAVSLIVTFKSAVELLACYEKLRPGGIVIDQPEKLSYTELGLQFMDRFGVQWGFMVEGSV